MTETLKSVIESIVREDYSHTQECLDSLSDEEREIVRVVVDAKRVELGERCDEFNRGVYSLWLRPPSDPVRKAG